MHSTRDDARDAERYRMLRSINAWVRPAIDAYWEPSIVQSNKTRDLTFNDLTAGLHLDAAVDQLIENKNGKK